MASDGKITVDKDNLITVSALRIKVTGIVLSAEWWGNKDGWYIEIGNANVPGGYSYWKQGQDGGYISMLNGQRVISTEIPQSIIDQTNDRIARNFRN